MIALFDIDGLFYSAVYKIVDRRDIRDLYDKHKIKDLVLSAIIDKSYDRLEQMAFDVVNDIEESNVPIESIEYYITLCSNNFRKEIEPAYKANRKRNNYANLLRRRFSEREDVFFSDTLEADDLVAERIKELNEDNYIIVSHDKDVLNLVGYHYDYYRPREIEGKAQNRRGLGYTSQDDHHAFTCFQLLNGDSSDNIKGLKGYGKKKSEKALEGLKGLSRYKKVIELYNNKEELKKNYKLIKLGKNE